MKKIASRQALSFRLLCAGLALNSFTACGNAKKSNESEPSVADSSTYTTEEMVTGTRLGAVQGSAEKKSLEFYLPGFSSSPCKLNWTPFFKEKKGGATIECANADENTRVSNIEIRDSLTDDPDMTGHRILNAHFRFQGLKSSGSGGGLIDYYLQIKENEETASFSSYGIQTRSKYLPSLTFAGENIASPELNTVFADFRTISSSDVRIQRTFAKLYMPYRHVWNTQISNETNLNIQMKDTDSEKSYRITLEPSMTEKYSVKVERSEGKDQTSGVSSYTNATASFTDKEETNVCVKIPNSALAGICI